MKIIFLALILPLNIYAAQIEILSPCEENLLINYQFNLAQESTVGVQTIKALKKLNITFAGTARGINSISNSPIGIDAMEVISDTEMNAYGWCYSVNGFEPTLFADEFVINNQDEILWWYGFAKYKDGEWITQCTPSHLRKESQFCKDLVEMNANNSRNSFQL